MTTAPSRSAKLSGEARGPRYAGSLIALHWLIALGIIGVLAPGLYMLRLPKGLPVKAALLNFHKSLGLTVFLLVLLRIAWCVWPAVSRPCRRCDRGNAPPRAPRRFFYTWG
jgi:cytochrome b561